MTAFKNLNRRIRLLILILFDQRNVMFFRDFAQDVNRLVSQLLRFHIGSGELLSDMCGIKLFRISINLFVKFIPTKNSSHDKNKKRYV